jgi:hypothetical protein
MKSAVLLRIIIAIMCGSVFALLCIQFLSPGKETMKSAGALEEIRKDQTVKLNIPQSLKLEHEELHAELAKAVKAGGATGSAAEIVAKLLHPHFVKEEEYALPPLGLLSLLAEGKVTPEMKGVLEMTNKLKAELPRMLEEHHNIVEALKKLSAAAEKEKKTEYVRFTEKLMSHARNEEDVLYPAAILVGEYIKLKLNK